MFEFIENVARYPFLQHAVAAGLLASVACGVVGTYVVVRRITYIAGGIAHCVLGGIGIARYLNIEHGWTWLTPLGGATVAAIVAALVIGWVSLRAKEREDTIISALYAVGMATGVLFIHITTGVATDLQSYLFGNILMVTPQQIWMIGLLNAVIVGAGLLFYKQLLAVCFDEEFARLRGVPVELFYLLLLCLAALTVVLLSSVVGIILVIALLSLPAAVAGFFCRSLWQMMISATLLCMLFVIGGLWTGYSLNLLAGPTIIVWAGGSYLLVTVARAAGRLRRA